MVVQANFPKGAVVTVDVIDVVADELSEVVAVVVAEELTVVVALDV
jgi:hypothetical protein